MWTNIHTILIIYLLIYLRNYFARFSAFEAALIMFEEGLKTKSERATARRVIYYMTVADPWVGEMTFLDLTARFLTPILFFEESESQSDQPVQSLTGSDHCQRFVIFRRYHCEILNFFSDFLHEGEVAYSGLRALASDGFYIQNDNYNLALQSFCKGKQ